MSLPRFAIINDVDAPIRKNVAEHIEGIGYCYMARSEDKNLRNFDGMNPERPTAIEDFGFSVEVGDQIAVFVRRGDSRATYEDGHPRRWQDGRAELILPLVDKASVKRRSKRRAA